MRLPLLSHAANPGSAGINVVSEIVWQYMLPSLERYVHRSLIGFPGNLILIQTTNPRGAKNATLSCPIRPLSRTLCVQEKRLSQRQLLSSPKVSSLPRISVENLNKAIDPGDAQRITTNMIPILTRTGFSPSSYPLLAINRLHQSLLISSLADNVTQELLDETIRTATKSAEALSTILCYGHPVRGVALAELGKMLAVDEPNPYLPTDDTDPRFPPSGAPRLKLAYNTLLRARKELLVGFGVANDGGEVGKEVRETLVSLEKELGIWYQGVRNVLEDTVQSEKQW
jgi:hypothetical protein